MHAPPNIWKETEDQVQLTACGPIPADSPLRGVPPCGGEVTDFWVQVDLDATLLGMTDYQIDEMGQHIVLFDGDERLLRFSSFDHPLILSFTTLTDITLTALGLDIREADCDDDVWNEWTSGQAHLSWHLDSHVSADQCSDLFCM